MTVPRQTIKCQKVSGDLIPGKTNPSYLTGACQCMYIQLLSHVQLFATPWTVAHQAPLLWKFPGRNIGVGGHFFLQGICHRPPNKNQDHQLRIGRSKNQKRLTKSCLDSPGRWTGIRDFSWSQVSRSLQSSGKRGVCSGPPLWLSKLSTGKKKHKVKAVSSVLFGHILRTIAGRYPQDQ